MIKSYVITVDEIDDVDDALEILREKMADVRFRKNSLGIISAHPDAVYSGIYKAVCNELAFPVVGISCDDQIADGEIGLYMFSIMILTGDNCSFACGHTADFTQPGDAEAFIGDCYRGLKQELGETPKLALMYTPFSEKCVPSACIEVISSLEPALPIFGTVAHAKKTYEGQSGIITLCKGDVSNEGVVMVLVAGDDVKPKFFVSTFNEEAMVIKDVGIATKCDKTVLMEIDGKNAVSLLDGLGFAKVKTGYANMHSGIITVAFVFDYSDVPGQQPYLVSRQPVEFTDCGISMAGYISEGAKISIAASTLESVIESAMGVVCRIKAAIDDGAHTALMYSCMGRRIGMLNNPMKEFEAIKSALDGTGINYTVSYAGGELSPALVTEGRSYNYSHNQTLVACVF
jgi:small ligand-binding sensory domain FIST